MKDAIKRMKLQVGEKIFEKKITTDKGLPRTYPEHIKNNNSFQNGQKDQK